MSKEDKKDILTYGIIMISIIFLMIITNRIRVGSFKSIPNLFGVVNTKASSKNVSDNFYSGVEDSDVKIEQMEPIKENNENADIKESQIEDIMVDTKK